MNTLKITAPIYALGLSLLIAGAAPAFAGNAEQPHMAPVSALYSGGYTGPDLGSERSPGFDARTAVRVRSAGHVAAPSEAGGGFDANRAIVAGAPEGSPARLAGTPIGVRG